MNHFNDYSQPLAPLSLFGEEEQEEKGLGFWEGLKSTINQYYTLGRSSEELLDLLDGDVDDAYLEQAISKIGVNKTLLKSAIFTNYTGSA